jgi:quinol monooxygenase YgiN
MSSEMPMFVVVGSIVVRRGERDHFVALSLDAVREARQHRECAYFAVSPDPIDSTRVNVCEMWTSFKALTHFRGAGPGDELASLIEHADITELDASPHAA